MTKSIVIIYFLLASFYATAQDFKCQDLYVWEFQDQDNMRNSFTKDLTNAVEEAFVNVKGCSVLQRRQFATLQSQVLNEVNIQSVREIKLSNNINKNLTTNGAKLVVFGVLTTISRKEYELRIRIEDLKTTKIVKLKSIDLDVNDLVDNNRKKIAIGKIVIDLIGQVSAENKPSVDETKGEKAIRMCLRGYSAVFKSCQGDAAAQTVTMIFTLKHELPNQAFESTQFGVKAYGDNSVFSMNYMAIGDRAVGNQNTGYTLTNSIPTDVPLTFTVTIGNILPRVKMFSKVIIPLYSRNENGGGVQGCSWEMINMPIQW